MRIKVLTTVLAVLGVGVWFPGLAAAAPTPVVATCGAILAGDAYLRADLNCKGGHGLALLQGSTLDFRGHKLTGDSGTAVKLYVDPENVLLPGPIVLKNGTIQGWTSGLVGIQNFQNDPGGLTANLSSMSFIGNGEAVPVRNAEQMDINVDKSNFKNNVGAIGGGKAFGSVTVQSSTFTGNAGGVMFGMYGDIAIMNSSFDKNDVAVMCTQAACTLTSDSFTNNTQAASLWLSDVAVSKSIFTNNGTALYAFDGSNNISDSAFKGNKVAVQFDPSTGRLTSNVFYGNGVGFSLPQPVDQPSSIVTLTKNIFDRNGDGIYAVNGVGASLGQNAATLNKRYGIYAPGATDLGGNYAFGNGAQPQCTGVKC